MQEAKILFPAIQSLSISNNTFYYSNDSTSHATAFIYQASKDLTDTDKTKLGDWLKKRLSLANVELLKK